MPHYDAWQVTVSSCLQKASTNVIILKIIFYLLAMFEANIAINITFLLFIVVATSKMKIVVIPLRVTTIR